MLRPKQSSTREVSKNSGHRGSWMLLGSLMGLLGGYMGIAGDWMGGYAILSMGLILIACATLCESMKLFILESCLAAVVSSALAYGMLNKLYTALMTGHIETITGPKGNRIKEIIFYDVQPTRFNWNIAGTSFLILVLIGAAMAMIHRILHRHDA